MRQRTITIFPHANWFCHQGRFHFGTPDGVCVRVWACDGAHKTSTHRINFIPDIHPVRHFNFHSGQILQWFFLMKKSDQESIYFYRLTFDLHLVRIQIYTTYVQNVRPMRFQWTFQLSFNFRESNKMEIAVRSMLQHLLCTNMIDVQWIRSSGDIPFIDSTSFVEYQQIIYIDWRIKGKTMIWWPKRNFIFDWALAIKKMTDIF